MNISAGLTRRGMKKKYDEHDEQIKAVFDAIRHLMSPPDKDQRRIGFRKEGK